MKIMYTENLPKKIYHGRECFDWSKSIGMKVKFKYEDINGCLTIISYESKKCRLMIEYNTEHFEIATHHFLDCKIGNLLGIKTTKYKYDIGEIVNGLEIIERIRYGNTHYKTKGYKYRCIKDGYEGKSSEGSIIKGSGCPVCANQIVIKGVNDIATTNPEIVPMIVNIEEAYSYGINTKKMLKTKCLECNYEKYSLPSTLIKHQFKCPRCGDGVSYPEKFIFCLLEQLGVDFDTQKSFKWSDKKIYDFYIKNSNTVIEAHGLQHYQDTGGSWYSYEEISENDNYKEELAKLNGVNNYIIIDCRYSDIAWIKDKVIKSQLSDIYNLSDINWLVCHEKGCSSMVKEACRLWNEFSNSANKISKEMKISRNTAIIYLMQGKELGWCNYDPEKNKSEAGKNYGKRYITK